MIMSSLCTSGVHSLQISQVSALVVRCLCLKPDHMVRDTHSGTRMLDYGMQGRSYDTICAATVLLFRSYIVRCHGRAPHLLPSARVGLAKLL